DAGGAVCDDVARPARSRAPSLTAGSAYRRGPKGRVSLACVATHAQPWALLTGSIRPVGQVGRGRLRGGYRTPVMLSRIAYSELVAVMNRSLRLGPPKVRL